MPGTDRDDPYRVLGVPPDASAARIREAYRRLANEVHPDRRTGAAERMAAVNDAYRVLRDPARRAMHDRARRQPGAGATAGSDGAHAAPPMSSEAATGTAPVEAMDRSRARVPWRGMAIFAVVGSVAVVAGSQFIEDPGEPAPDNILRPGSCVVIEADRDAREVNCTGGGDSVVREVVAFDESCPYGTEAHRDRQGMGWACVESTN